MAGWAGHGDGYSGDNAGREGGAGVQWTPIAEIILKKLRSVRHFVKLISGNLILVELCMPISCSKRPWAIGN